MPPTIEEQDYQDDYAEEQQHNAERRERLKNCLPDIASEVTMALSDAGIIMAVFFTVPSAGPLMTYATPLNPTDAEWARVRDIVKPIVSRAVGADDLICQETPCAAAGMPMAAADLLVDSDVLNIDY
jgi:hypothetical protein